MDKVIAMTSLVSKTEFRNAMARVCAPVHVITTNGPAGRGGFTATAMCSVTDEPPTLLICMNGRSTQCDLFLQNRHFCVNVLGEDHHELAHIFASGAANIDERFEAAGWAHFASGTPALEDAIVNFDCELSESHFVGTHHIFFARVRELRIRNEGGALLYFDRNYLPVPRRFDDEPSDGFPKAEDLL